jgi:hypothetical protein
MLQENLGDEFVYSEYHSNGKTLENSPEITAQKTHDFDLALPKNPEYIHIVQCRVIDDCIKSWEKIAPDWPDKRHHYGNFVSKWIVAPVPNRLIVYYHDLLDDAEVWVNKVISFIK